MARCVTFIRSARSSPPRLSHTLTVHHGQGRFTLEQKLGIPLEQGFLSVFSPKLCGFIAPLLD